MPRFTYIAKDILGKTSKGNVEADDVQALYEKLDEDGLFCIEYKQLAAQSRKSKLYKLKTSDLVMFCRKLSTMMASGMSITNTLDIMCTSAEKPTLKKLYLELYESVRGGEPLSQAMRGCDGAFPSLLINLVESGEESGNVDMMVEKLAVYYEKQSKIAGKIKTATTYPKLLGTMCVGVIVILFTFVLPSIFDVFEDQELPVMTRVMMAMSDYLINYWYVCILVVIILIVLGKIALGTAQVSFLKDKLSLKLPLIGKLMKKIYSARFASTLAILYSSGLTLLNAIRLSINVVENSCIVKSLNKVVEDISIGQPLSESIAESDVFDQLLPSMIKIGEETGSLDTVLISVSDFYETETESAIERLLGILEPVLLIFMAIVIGTILVSVIVPIFSSYGKI